MYAASRNERTCRLCNLPYNAKGYCKKHYDRLRLHGDANWTQPPRSGYVNHNGYREVSVPYDSPFVEMAHGTRRKGYRVSEHRLVIAQQLGRPLRRDESVHHKNGDRLDNRIENLEIWTSSQPSGQRIEDLVSWAREILSLYNSDYVRGLIS